MPVASSRPNTGRVSLQELHGIGSSIVTRTNIRPEVGRPHGAAKRPGKRRKALKAEVTDRWLTLTNGL
jgi:hypothetical protein